MLIEYSYPKEFKFLFKNFDKLKNSEELRELDGIGSQLDIASFSRKFFSKRGLTTADVSIDSNSNVDNVDVLQYYAEVSKPVHKLNSYFLLWKYGNQLFGEDKMVKILKYQFQKDIYINDFYNFNVPYCFNYSCMDVVSSGLPFVRRIKSNPPKHLTSFISQLIQFVIYTSNSQSGAVGLADMLICSAWYVEKLLNKWYKTEKEKQEDKYGIWVQIKQELQSFIYAINQPSRNSTQSPFTNVSLFDEVFLKKLCNEYIFPDGKKVPIPLVQKLQILYMDLMNSILRETPVTFPVTTACFAVDEDRNVLDTKFLDLIIEKNEEFAFMNIYAGAQSTLSSCCRLRSEGENEYFNMFGSGGTKIGSLGVVTLNLPRISYTSKTQEEFLKRLKELVTVAAEVNHIKRNILMKRINNGYSPLYSLGIMVLNKQYSTVGLVGINEALEILGLNVLTEEGQSFIIKLLEVVNTTNNKMQKRFNAPHNCEQVPAESSSVVLATADKIMGYNKKYSLYSNQFVPLIVECDILDRIKLQGMFDSYMSGGAILHLNFSERVTDREFIKNLLTKSIKMGTVYQSINYNIQRCKNEHMSVGKNEKCPICGEIITDNFTRVVGFLINTKNWHKVRREEDYVNRQWYK